MRLRYLISLLVYFAIMLRVIGLNAPTDYNGYRQHLTKSVILNLENPLKPEIDDIDGKHYIFMQEFPIYQTIVSIICKLTNNYSWFMLRIFSVICFILALFLLWELYPNPTVLIVFLFSPLSIAMSRSCQPDMLMIAMQLVAILSFKKKEFFEGFIGLLIAGLIKPMALCVIVPIMCLRIGKKGYLAILMALIGCFWWWVWYSNPIRMASGYPGTAILNSQYILTSIYYQLSHLGFYKDMGFHLFKTALTPIGIIFIYGLFKHWNKFWGFWVISSFLALSMFPEQSRQEYYLLMTIIPCSYFMGRAIDG